MNNARVIEAFKRAVITLEECVAHVDSKLTIKDGQVSVEISADSADDEPR